MIFSARLRLDYENFDSRSAFAQDDRCDGRSIGSPRHSTKVPKRLAVLHSGINTVCFWLCIGRDSLHCHKRATEDRKGPIPSIVIFQKEKTHQGVFSFWSGRREIDRVRFPSENPIQNKKSPHAGGFFVLERATGIGPARSAWEAEVLPLNYARI